MKTFKIILYIILLLGMVIVGIVEDIDPMLMTVIGYTCGFGCGFIMFYKPKNKNDNTIEDYSPENIK